MKKYKLNIILGILLFTLVSTLSFAQNVEFDKDNFRSDKEGFKAAMKNLKEGYSLYNQRTKGTYRLALDFLLKANKFNPNNAELNYRIGASYLRSIDKLKSLSYLKKAYELNRNVAPDIPFLLGRSYQLNLNFDKAIEEFNAYKNGLAPRELSDNRKAIDKKIEECKVGKELVANPERVFIDNLGSSLNSSYSDYSPLISADESKLIYTSRRENTTGGGKDPSDDKYFEDIYISYNKNKKWGKGENIGKPLNTSNNDATVGLSPDGQELFTFQGKKNGGDIYVSTLKGDEWTSPKPLPKQINTEFHESSASFSFDGRTMYFVSNREDGYGQHDIYMTTKNIKGKWGEAKNLGSVINTEYDEEGVFMHPDGRTMYFSSRGHKTMGGYDIFKTTIDDKGKWTEPVNLGYPINTPDEDLFFVINASGKRGYYSSEKAEGYGSHDIYLITFLGPEKPLIQSNEDNLIASIANPVSETMIEESVEIKTTRLTILKGTIKDGFTLKPLEAQIEIIDNEKNEVISTSSSNSSTGKFLISLPSGKNYGIAVKAESYLFHSENFNIPAATNYQEVALEILLHKLEVGSKIILKNIFFDYAKATLRSESFGELDRLLKLLTNYPTTRIEISGHTDNKGSVKTNTVLSEARAKSVVDYLINKGIAADRLEYKGYAYFQPVTTNDTEEGRQQNRRVEFKILSK